MVLQHKSLQASYGQPPVSRSINKAAGDKEGVFGRKSDTEGKLEKREEKGLQLGCRSEDI